MEGNQGQFPFGAIVLGQIHHLDGIHQAVQLLDDLVNNLVIAGSNNGHAHDVAQFCFANGNAVQIEAFPAEQVGHAVKGTEPVLHQNANRVLHGYTILCGFNRSTIISETDAPAGTMGKTSSSFSTRNSTSMGPSE